MLVFAGQLSLFLDSLDILQLISALQYSSFEFEENIKSVLKLLDFSSFLSFLPNPLKVFGIVDEMSFLVIGIKSFLPLLGFLFLLYLVKILIEIDKVPTFLERYTMKFYFKFNWSGICQIISTSIVNISISTFY